jgi:protein-S-isoprenylcysteine O-methyltransferase Ste14
MQGEQALRAVFFTLFFLMLGIRAYYGWRGRQRGESSWAVEEDTVDREGRWSVLLRGLLFVYMLAAATLYAVNPAWISTLAIPLPAWSRWLGAALGALSLPLLIWVHQSLGKHWSTNLQVREEHALVTTGPYRWVRHPMYTMLFGYFVGLTLLSATWLVATLTVISILVLYRRIGIEERMMQEQFGDEYRAYMEHTGQLLPRLRKPPRSTPDRFTG